jgi:NAD(P)-dependent dehydrogenase (short-subunit alcohol dehydrogenase family)
MNVNLTRFGTLINFETFRPYSIPYFFWVAGIHLKKPLLKATLPEMNRMIDVHFRTPMELIKGFHATRQSPYHLVVIASTSSWRLREHETIYCALKAAKAAFARNFARELAEDLPGSKVTLVNPGGLATPNFWGGQDVSKFMDPSVVAGIIWDKVQSQKKLYRELQIMRRDDGTPRITYGPRTPETP